VKRFIFAFNMDFTEGNILAKRKCFIIMPFSGTKTVTTKEDWDKIYDDFFKPAWEELDFICERVNVKRGSITNEIIEKLFAADIVFADLTDTNPNVMYELGVRHSFKKPSIMFKQIGSDIPFDVSDYKVHDYENNLVGLRKFKELIKEIVKDLDANPSKPDNPVWDLIRHGGFMIDHYKNIENINKLSSLLIEIYLNRKAIDKIIKEIDKGSYESKKPQFYGSELMQLSIECSSLLVSTRYIDLERNELAEINHLRYRIDRFSKLALILSDFNVRNKFSKKDMDAFRNQCVKIMENIDTVYKIIENKIDQYQKNL
jgi:hypothetical protein